MPSEKTIVEKMYLKPGMSVLIIDPPEGYADRIGELPPDIRMVEAPESGLDVVEIFVMKMSELESRIKMLSPFLKPSSIIWITYPKGSSGIDTDLNRDIIWRKAREMGMEAVANFAVDDVWTAMRLRSNR